MFIVFLCHYYLLCGICLLSLYLEPKIYRMATILLLFAAEIVCNVNCNKTPIQQICHIFTFQQTFFKLIVIYSSLWLWIWQTVCTKYDYNQMTISKWIWKISSWWRHRCNTFYLYMHIENWKHSLQFTLHTRTSTFFFRSLWWQWMTDSQIHSLMHYVSFNVQMSKLYISIMNYQQLHLT